MSTSEPDLIDPLDLQIESRNQQRSVGRLWHLVSRSVRLVWSAGWLLFAGLLTVQVTTAVLLAAQIVVVERLLTAVLELDGGGADPAGLVWPTMALAGLMAGATVLGAARANLGRYLGESVASRTYQEFLQTAAAVSLRYFESATFYDRLQRVEASVATRPFQVTQALFGIIGGAAAALGVGAVLVGIHPVLPALLIIGGAPMMLANRRESRREFAFSVAQTPRRRHRLYLSYLLTARDNAKEVRAFDLGQALRSRFHENYGEYLVDLARHLRRRTLLSLIGNLGTALVLTGTLLVLVLLIAEGQVSVAQAGAALVAIRTLQGQIQTLLGGTQAIFESGLFLQDVDNFMAVGDGARDEESGEEPPTDFEVIAVEDVRFAYPGSSAEALKGVDLQIRRGQVVALVGENGSGKTTLAKVLAGLYDPSSGSVRWDGTDTRSYSRGALRTRVAVIFQDFVRYAFSARENIELGRVSHAGDDVRMHDAARRAGAESFLSSLPQGFETTLSRIFKGGRDLSGGQWQRVAIARAFYRDAQLMILDEPTAALDPRAESELYAALRDVLAGRTAVFISHRFSSVRSADVIYVMEDGRVVEAGSHDELIVAAGRYAELFRLQAAAYLDPQAQEEA